MLEHYGTHMDAPAHFAPGITTVDKIPVEKFFGPAVIIDVRNEAERNPDYQLTVKRIEAWEEKHGKVPAGAIVVLLTGWASRWPDVSRYRNQDANGIMHFPGFFRGRGKIAAGTENQRIGLRHVEHRSGKLKGFSGASSGAWGGRFSIGESGGFAGFAGGRGVFDHGADQVGRRFRWPGTGVRVGGRKVGAPG